MNRHMSDCHGIAECRKDTVIGAPRHEYEAVAGNDRRMQRIGEPPSRRARGLERQPPRFAVGKENAARKGSTRVRRRHERDAHEIGNAGLRPRLRRIHDDKETAVELVDGIGKRLKAWVQLHVKRCKVDAVEMNSSDSALGEWHGLHIERQVGDPDMARLEEVDVPLVRIEQDDSGLVSGAAENEVPVGELQARLSASSLGWGRCARASRAQLIGAGRQHHLDLGGQAVRLLWLASLPGLGFRHGGFDRSKIRSGIAGRRRHPKDAGIVRESRKCGRQREGHRESRGEGDRREPTAPLSRKRKQNLEQEKSALHFPVPPFPQDLDHLH